MIDSLLHDVVVEEPGVEWGSLADWFAALGTWAGACCTFLSVLAIGGGLLWEIRRRREDDERQAQEQRDVEKHQARLITARLAIGYNSRDSWNGTITVSNQSAGQATDVEVSVGLRGDPLLPDGSRVAALPARVGVEFLKWIEEVPPGQITVPKVSLPHDLPLPPTGMDPIYASVERAYLVRLEFTDAEGRRWVRLGTGQPERVIVAE